MKDVLDQAERRTKSANAQAISKKQNAAALFSIGIPNNSVLKYETAVRSGKYLLIAHGSESEIAKAKEAIQMSGPQEMEEHAG